MTRLTTLLLISLTTAHAQDNWPQFRGADSRGVGTNENLPVSWSATENVEWKTDLPGRGWSSPIVWGKRVFLTTVINSGTSEKPKKGLYFGGNRPDAPDTVHQWKVYCLDLETGKILWERQVHEGKPQSSIHLKNSYASETPVTDGERVYCYFGNLGLFVFDLDGIPAWSKKFKPRKTRYGWGTAASPVLHQDRLYILNDNDEDSWLLALDKKSGDEVWRTERDEKSNWSNPYIWENELRTEIIVPGTMRVRSYDLAGKELWSFKGMSSITIATPYAADGLLYISSGYVGDAKKPLYAIRPGASGDISLRPFKETTNKFVAWCNWKAAPYNPTTLLYHNQLYVLLDRGWVAAFHPKTGDSIYERTRLPPGPGFTVSPWAYNGKIFCLNEDGTTFVCTAGKKLEVLHTNTLADDDMCMATPAIAGDRLVIRTAARVYCIQQAKVSTGFDRHLAAIKAVGPEGKGNVEAAEAFKILSTADADAILPLLRAIESSGPVARNWLRSAVEVIVERELKAKKALPVDDLRGFLLDTGQAPEARRFAFDLLAKIDGPAAENLVPGFLQDPSTELRRDAVAQLMSAGKALVDQDDKPAATKTYRKALDAARDPDQIKEIANQLTKTLGQEVDLPRHFGFLTQWHLIGPFGNSGREGFTTVYPPEQQIDLAAAYPGKDGTEVKWQAVEAVDEYGKIDVNPALGKLKEVTAYAFTEFLAPEARPAELRLGCKNAWKVWLNGELLFGRDEYHRGQRIDQYKLPVQLKAGKNAILVKLCQNEQKEKWTVEWEFQLRVCDATGTAVLATDRDD